MSSAGGRHSVEQCSASSTQHVDDIIGVSMIEQENSSCASADDHSALKHLLAFAFIWGFGSSLLLRYHVSCLCINILVALNNRDN